MVIAVWIILAAALLGAASVVLAKLPSVLSRPNAFVGRVKMATASEGLWSYVLRKIRQGLSRIWHFVLEAKDLKPTPLITHQVQKVKQVFKVRIRADKTEPLWMPEVAAIIDEAKAAKDEKTAESLYLNAIKNDPNNKEAYEGLGRLYLQEKNFTEAVETFKFLTRLDPKRDTYWSNLGLSQYSVQAYKESAASYEKALQINSKIPARWVNLSMAYEALHDVPRSIKALNRAVEMAPRNINYLMMLSDAYLKVQNKVRAEEVLEQILAIDPTFKIAREKLMKIRI